MKKTLIAGALYSLPLFAIAVTLEDTAITIGKIIGSIVPIVGALLLIYFFWGIAQYVGAGGDAEKQAEARNMMIYAVIGMFVAFSIFGLVRLLGATVGLSTTDVGSGADLPVFTGLKQDLGL